MRKVLQRSSPPMPVTVNGVSIARADIAREVQNHHGGSPKQAWEEATRALVIRELLTQRARALGLLAEPRVADGLRETEEEALIRGLLEAEIDTPKADEATCRRYYLANLHRFRSADLFEPLHILFKAAQTCQAAYADAIERAHAILAELTRRPERFEELARSLSDCPSAAEGGRLGQVAHGDTTPAFEAAMTSLEAGQICAHPVCTPYGVHILRLDRKVCGRVLPFEQVQARVAAYLEECSWHRAAAQYVSLLAGQASISGIDMRGATSPLVQ
ncbi:MAG: peptidylprolyl isomerase [Acetobacteraceae bacterium]